MNTDRELLTLAAKAGGIELVWNDADQPGYFSEWRGMAQWNYWNSLTDGGDAIKLAVKLHMHLGIESHAANAWQTYGRTEFCSEPLGQNGNAAVYRAITRVAAAAGKAMR